VKQDVADGTAPQRLNRAKSDDSLTKLTKAPSSRVLRVPEERRSAVATPTAHLSTAAILEQVLGITRELLSELGNDRAIAAVEGSAHLDRDLGLGSLERVELMVRLDAAFRVRLPDRAVAEANTLDDLVTAVLAAFAGSADVAAPAISPAAGAAAAPVRAPRPGVGVETAETLLDVLRHRARFDADHAHIFLYGEEDSASTITFGQLFERADRVAHALAHRGVAAGQTVALMLPTSAEFFYSFFGVLLAGGIPVPIYPPFRADRIEEYAARQSGILRNAEARLLITFRRAEAVARLLTPQVPSLKGVVNAERLLGAAPNAARAAAPGAGPLLLHQPRWRDIAFLQYTSGSTGSPKGVMLTHANLLANIRAIGEAAAIGPEDVGVTWLPLYHDMGLIGTWLTPLYFGFPVAVYSPLAFLTRPERWLRAIHTHRGTLTAAPNFAYELCVRKIRDADIEGIDLSSMRAMLNGAEPVGAETLERFAARFAKYGLRREALTPVYGLAESAVAVTVPPLGRDPVVDHIEREAFEREGRAVPAPAPPEHGDRRVISFVAVGRALPRHEVRVVNAAGRDSGERIEGALWFRGPSATRGYYRNPEATAQLFPELAPGASLPEESAEYPWLDSGDRAYRADGDVYVTGRVKDIIIKAGRNIYPHEVEGIAAGVEGVRRGCVVAFGVRDAASGTERLVVTAEVRASDAGGKSRISRAITEQVAAGVGLPPDVVELVPPQSIPKTSSGKLRREETKRLYLAGTLGASRGPIWWQMTRLAVASSLGFARRAFSRTLEFLYGIYVGLIFAVWILPTWTLVRLAPSRDSAARITSRALRLLFVLAGCPVRVKGRENLPAGEAVIYVSNHTSFADVIALMAGLGVGYRFISKIEVNSMPFIGMFLRKLGHLSFDRSDPQARIRQMKEIEESLQQGVPVFIFPEGTFTPHEGIRPFQLGAFKAAVSTGRAICPVVLRGTRQFLRDENILPRPASLSLTILPLIHPAAPATDSDWQEVVRLRDETRAVIAQHSGEPML
jgi:1-acyl-sn-glycerol-3-phosphate acyltransferase